MAFSTDTINIFIIFALPVLAGTCLVVALIVVRFLADVHSVRSHPGPLAGKLSDAWLGWVAYRGKVNYSIHEAHQKYGTFVRIAPNHISVADPAALQSIYGHGSNAMKSDFYKAGVHFGGIPSVFTTQSREDHARKRKIISHIFSPKSVQELEPIIRRYQLTFIKHWDELALASAKGISGSKGSCNWVAKDGRAWFDCMPWFSYQAFDVISDLAFGAPFGMIEKVKDGALIAKSQKDAILAFDTKDASFPVTELLAVKAMKLRAEFATASAVWPMWIRRMLPYLPWYGTRFRAMESMATVAVTALARRLAAPVFRPDLLSGLLEVQDKKGAPLSNRELSAEAATLLSAGSDTTSNTMCAITYYLASNPCVQAKLQRELEEVLGKPNPNMSADDYSTEDSLSERVKNLKYLEAVIYETLRLHSTIGLGLPRVVPEGGLTILGKTFVPGTVVSVPAYTLHRNRAVFGEDADEFRPERWLEGDSTAMHKAFIGFSVGPRACLGRNLAFLNLTTLTAIIAHRYDVVLESPGELLAVRDGFLRKVLYCNVGIKRRGA